MGKQCRTDNHYENSCIFPFVSGAVPVVPLNFSALAYEMGFTNDRDILESCVRELINSISRSVNQSRNVEFEFAGIGKLSIRHKKVRMRFYKEFLESLDGSGHLVNALENVGLL